MTAPSTLGKSSYLRPWQTTAHALQTVGCRPATSPLAASHGHRVFPRWDRSDCAAHAPQRPQARAWYPYAGTSLAQCRSAPAGAAGMISARTVPWTQWRTVTTHGSSRPRTMCVVSACHACRDPHPCRLESLGLCLRCSANHNFPDPQQSQLLPRAANDSCDT